MGRRVSVMMHGISKARSLITDRDKHRSNLYWSSDITGAAGGAVA
jgi:hypothetical protein